MTRPTAATQQAERKPTSSTSHCRGLLTRAEGHASEAFLIASAGYTNDALLHMLEGLRLELRALGLRLEASILDGLDGLAATLRPPTEDDPVGDEIEFLRAEDEQALAQYEAESHLPTYEPDTDPLLGETSSRREEGRMP